jgi:hypothetical protein
MNRTTSEAPGLIRLLDLRPGQKLRDGHDVGRRQRAHYGPPNHAPTDSYKTKTCNVISRVFAAEVPDNALADYAACQAFVDRILRSAWWRRRYPETTCLTIEQARIDSGPSWAYTAQARIRLNRFAGKTKHVLLHEMAHFSHAWVVKRYQRRKYSQDDADHGRVYLDLLLELIGHVMGHDLESKIVAALREHGIPLRRREPDSRIKPWRGSQEALVRARVADRERRVAAQQARPARSARLRPLGTSTLNTIDT